MERRTIYKLVNKVVQLKTSVSIFFELTNQIRKKFNFY